MDSGTLALLYFVVILLDGSRTAVSKGTMSCRTHMGDFRLVGDQRLESKGLRLEAGDRRWEAGGQRLVGEGDVWTDVRTYEHMGRTLYEQ